MQKRQRIPRFHNMALVVFTYGPFEMTARQLCLSMVAVLFAANLWRVLGWFALLPAVLLLPFGWLTIGGRPLEAWGLCLLRYWLAPRVYVWREEERSAPDGGESA